MAYIVPAELPHSCALCKFALVKNYRPFYASEKPNTMDIVCFLDKGKRIKEMATNDYDTKAEWCPLVEVKKAEYIPLEVIKRKIEGIKAADQCDQTVVYDLQLLHSLEMVLEWINSPDYAAYLERWRNDQD